MITVRVALGDESRFNFKRFARNRRHRFQHHRRSFGARDHLVQTIDKRQPVPRLHYLYREPVCRLTLVERRRQQIAAHLQKCLRLRRRHPRRQ